MDRAIDLEALLSQASWLRRLAAHLVLDPDRAEDLVQDTYRAALENPPAQGAHLRGWLARVMRHLAINKSREADVRRWHELRARRGDAWTAEDVDDGIALQGKVIQAVDTLDEPYRTVITLHYFAGLSAKEIAERQGEKHAAVRKRLERAREILRARLDREYGGDRRAWCLILAGFLRKEPLPIGTTAATKSLAVGAVAVALSIVALLLWIRLQPERSENRPRAAVADTLATPSVERSRLAEGTGTPRAPAAEPSIPVDRERDLFGIVLDANDAPIADASVEAFRDDSAGFSWDPESPARRRPVAKTRSNTMGRFAMRVPPDRPLDLEVKAAGFATTRLGYRNPGEEIAVHVHVATTLSGRVSTSDGLAVAGARVELVTTDGTVDMASVRLGEVQTDDSGRFRLEDLPAVGATLRVVPTSTWAPRKLEVDLREGTDSHLDIELVQGRKMRGRVLDKETNEPIPGAVVGETWWNHRSTRANAQGEYELTGLPESGCVVLQASAPEHANDILVFGSESGQLDLPERLDFVLERGVIVTGLVVDTDGRPVEGAYVAGVPRQPVDPSIAEVVRIRGRTDDRGRFELRVASRRLAVLVLARNEGSGALVRHFPATDPGADVLPINDLGTLVLPEASRVRGRLVDSAGSPIPDWVVTATETEYTPNVVAHGADSERAFLARTLRHVARTDDLGRFAFADLAGGDYQVTARAQESTAGFTELVSIQPGESREGFEIAIPSVGTIEGFVKDSAGNGLAGVKVAALSGVHLQGQARGAAFTNATGHFVLNGLYFSRYSLDIHATRSAGETRAFLPKVLPSVEVGTKDLPIVLDRAETIHGKFVDARGAPIGTGLVLARVSGGDQQFSATLNADGTFSVDVPVGVAVDLEGRASTGPESQPVARRESVLPTDPDVTLQLPR